MVEKDVDPTDRSRHKIGLGDNPTFSFPESDTYQRLLWISAYDQPRVHWSITIGSHRGPHADRDRWIQELLRPFDDGFCGVHGIEMTRPSLISYGPLVLTRCPTLSLCVDNGRCAERRQQDCREKMEKDETNKERNRHGSGLVKESRCDVFALVWRSLVSSYGIRASSAGVRSLVVAQAMERTVHQQWLPFPQEFGEELSQSRTAHHLRGPVSAQTVLREAASYSLGSWSN
ncbi:MAG: hypothetical protein OJF51_004603 [Nitrospira sp.]|nr:MAG: hypothetical protein OJF51_004603 [Nitrospira sp.]